MYKVELRRYAMPLRSESLTSATLCATALLHQHHASRKDLYCQPFNALTWTMYCVILLAYLAEDIVPAISKEFLCTLKLEPFSLLTFTGWRSWPGQEVHASSLGTAIGYGGQFDQPLQMRFGLIFSSFDRPGKVLHPVGPPASTVLSPSPSCPPAISRGSFFLHSRSQCEAWHRRQRIAQDLPRCPSSVGSPRCHRWGTLPVTLRHQFAPSL
jgi:hypothetical protein